MSPATGRKVLFVVGLCLLLGVLAHAENDSNRRSYSKYLVYGSPHTSSLRFNPFVYRPTEDEYEGGDENNGVETKYKREPTPINFYWRTMMSRLGKYNVNKIQR